MTGIHQSVIDKYVADFKLTQPLKKATASLISWSSRGTTGVQIVKKILIALPWIWIKSYEGPLWCINKLFSVITKRTLKIVLDQSQLLSKAVSLSSSTEKESDFRVAVERLKCEQLRALHEKICRSEEINSGVKELPESDAKLVKKKLSEFTIELLRFCERNHIDDREKLKKMIHPVGVQEFLGIPKEWLKEIQTNAIVSGVVDVLTDLTSASTKKAQSERLMASALEACWGAVSRNGQDVPAATSERLRTERLEYEAASEGFISYIIKEEMVKVVDAQFAKWGLVNQNRSAEYISFLKNSSLGDDRHMGNIALWNAELEKYHINPNNFKPLETIQAGFLKMLAKWREIEQDAEVRAELARTGNLQCVIDYHQQIDTVSTQLEKLIQAHRHRALSKSQVLIPSIKEADTAASTMLALLPKVITEPAHASATIKLLVSNSQALESALDKLSALDDGVNKLPQVVFKLKNELMNFKISVEAVVLQMKELTALRAMQRRIAEPTAEDRAYYSKHGIDPNLQGVTTAISNYERACWESITEIEAIKNQSHTIFEEAMKNHQAVLATRDSHDDITSLETLLAGPLRTTALVLRPIDYISFSPFDLDGVKRFLCKMGTTFLKHKAAEVGDVVLRKPCHTEVFLKGVVSEWLGAPSHSCLT